MRVADLLSTKGREVITIDRNRPVRDAAALLRERGIGALVVTGGGGPYAGILSERDIVRGLAQVGSSVLDTSVSELMSTDVAVCGPDSTVAELMAVMTERRVRHLPVLEDGRLVGMISIGDVVKSRLSELERERFELLEYVHAR
jgi:CBS domain-containing protein